MKEAEVFKDNNWEEIKFKELKKDDKFRVYDLSGKMSINDKGKSIFIAMNDAFIDDKNNQWTINLIDAEDE